ncbi:hypothetical protein R6Q57_029829 [Mikania cordata]
MSTKLPSRILFVIITIAITVTASPTSVDLDLLRLPSDDPVSSSLCPISVNPGSCPVKCFRTDPVCGVDNITYWCGCPEALCAGVSVAKVGFCDFENGGSGQLLFVHTLVQHQEIVSKIKIMIYEFSQVALAVVVAEVVCTMGLRLAATVVVEVMPAILGGCDGGFGYGGVIDGGKDVGVGLTMMVVLA